MFTQATPEKVRSPMEIPPTVKMTENKDAPAIKNITVNFAEPVSAAGQAVPPVPPMGGSAALSIAMPKVVSWTSVLASQAACLLLLGAIFFMPHQLGESGWWTGLKAGSLASALPGALKFVEIVSAIAGFILIPLFRGDSRGRLMLNISASLIILLILAMLQQHLIGINLVLLPIVGLLALAALSAVLQARTLDPQSEVLQTWQMLFSIAVIVMWVLPSVESVSDPAFAQILNTLGGPILRDIFTLGGIGALLAGVMAISESQGTFSVVGNRVIRGLILAAFLIVSAVGLVAALSISHVLAGPAMTKGWFGVGVMWLFMLMTACVVLTWAGLTHQFCRKAITGNDHNPTAMSAVAAVRA
ncbi:MAG: hypothetical protein ACP5VQ_10010 [Phycisphaerae bacterium]